MFPPLVHSPREEVQVELAHHLPCAGVIDTVECDVRVPHGGALHQLEGEAQQLLVDIQQALRHHLHGEVLLQQVLVHRVLGLLHLAAGGGGAGLGGAAIEKHYLSGRL